MNLRDRDDTWDRYDRDENDFPQPGRGYYDEGTGCYDDPEPLPEASDEADNECGGVLGADGHIHSDADPGL